MRSESFGTEVDGGGSAKNKINRRRDREDRAAGVHATTPRLSWKLFKVERAVSPGEPPSIPPRDHYVSSLFSFFFFFFFFVVLFSSSFDCEGIRGIIRLIWTIDGSEDVCSLCVSSSPFFLFLFF